MTLLPLQLLVIPKSFFLRLFDIDETLAERALKVPAVHCRPLLQGFPQQLLASLHVGQGELARFNQMRHHRLGAAAEKSQQVVDQPGLRGIARDGRFKDMRVADFLYTPQCQLALKPVNSRLNGGIGRTAALGK